MTRSFAANTTHQTYDQYEIVQQTQDFGSRGWWWLQQDAEWACGDALHRHSTLPALMGPLLPSASWPKYPFACRISALSEKVKLQAVRLGLWKGDLELQNGIHCTERYSQGQLQAFYTGQPVFVLALQVLVCLHHLCKEISLLREPG